MKKSEACVSVSSASIDDRVTICFGACHYFAMFEIVCVLVLPVMLIIYYLIQRVVVHHTSMETQLMIHDLLVEAMNKHDHDFGDEVV